MTLKRKALEWAAVSSMKFEDHVTETRIRHFNSFHDLGKPLALGNNFDPSRIKIFWPSSYNWAMTHKWLIPILNEFQENFEVIFKPITPYRNAVVIEVQIDDQVYPIAIDRYDLVEVNYDCAANVVLYFKMQFATSGYNKSNIVPGGFIPAHSNIYLQLKKLRKLRDQQSFQFEAYGRFGERFAKTIRGQAVKILSEQESLNYNGGIGRVSYQKSLTEVAQSKVCVDLPGNGPLCFRLIDYLAVGACVVAYPHKAQLPVPLEHGKNIIYCKEDMSDLPELCEYYAQNSKEREAIAQNARAYFDQYLSRPKLASYYINTILQRTGKLDNSDSLYSKFDRQILRGNSNLSRGKSQENASVT